jgi:hypothetical protein
VQQASRDTAFNTMDASHGAPTHPCFSCRGISQLYRSPDTTHLVGNLKDQLREMKATRDQLTSELTSLQKSTRATKVCTHVCSCRDTQQPGCAEKRGR